MARSSIFSSLSVPLKRQAAMCICFSIFRRCHSLTFGLIVLAMLAWSYSCQAVFLWSDLGATQVHETGPGTDILGGGLRRDNSSTDTLYFKFHVDPLSDASTEL